MWGQTPFSIRVMLVIQVSLTETAQLMQVSLAATANLKQPAHDWPDLPDSVAGTCAADT
jgi:hypothetical protein